MALFAVSFRIADGKDYDERYTSLVKAVESQAVAGVLWAETSSFYLLIFNGSAEELKSNINNNAELKKDDIFLVINLSERGYAQNGASKEGLLNTLMTMC